MNKEGGISCTAYEHNVNANDQEMLLFVKCSKKIRLNEPGRHLPPKKKKKKRKKREEKEIFWGTAFQPSV